MSFPTLTTPRLLLRQIVPDDRQFVFEGLSHPEVTRYYGVHYDSLEATGVQMDFFSQLQQYGTGIWWGICPPDNSTFYGAGGFSSMSSVHRKAEIGFWLLPRFWRMGIMMEAFAVICDYGFQKLGLHRIEGFVETENTACRAAMKKLGFRHEGTMQDCEWKNGRFISLDIFAKRPTD